MTRQTPPLGSKSRRERRQQLREEQASAPIRKRRSQLPAKRPAWQSPTAIVTALAVVATIVLVVVINLKPAAAPSTALIAPVNPVPASIARDGSTLGLSSAPVKVDVWEDFQCPYCKIWTEAWESRIIPDFVASGTVRYQFHDYAFIGTGKDPDESLATAVAVQCAGDQGKFWEYHNWLYANQNPDGENKGWFKNDRLDAIALKVGLNQATFDTCRADPAKATAVRAEEAAGSSLGIDSTPSIFVNGTKVTLDTYDALAAKIRGLVPASAAPAASPSAVPSNAPSTGSSPATSP